MGVDLNYSLNNKLFQNSIIRKWRNEQFILPSLLALDLFTFVVYQTIDKIKPYHDHIKRFVMHTLQVIIEDKQLNKEPICLVFTDCY